MTVIELKFPAGGRLHATPWGRHVNEGATEWPISPWRIQRALVATWYLKARDEIQESVMHSLMEVLACAAPSFGLPPAVQSHTRHYMPGRGTDKPKVFDTFVQSSQPVCIAWNTTLDEAQHRALSILCERLGYLGRAESIVEASLMSEVAEIKTNSNPLPLGSAIPEGCELVRVLCASDPQAHAIWLAANQPKDEPKAKAAKTKLKANAPNLPPTIFDALHAETATLQAQGWQIPPGSRWVDYVRRIECFEPEFLRPKKSGGKPVNVARFAIASNVLPRITQAISVADRFHKTLVTYADKRQVKNPGIFTGLGPDKQPLANHQHAHIFCELGDQRDAIGYITLYAPGGFDDEAQAVIEDVQRSRLWGKGDHDIHLILLGFGDEQTFQSPLFAKSAKWRSLTPFIGTQHLKTYGDGRPKLDAHGWQQGSAASCLLQQLEKDPRTASKLKAGGLKKLNAIKVRQDRHLRCLQFQTRRPDGGGQRGNGDCGAFTLEFEYEIQGPLAFGYGSHFGLGLFVPADPSS